MSIASLRSNGSWVLYLSESGTSYTVTPDHPNYKKIEEALKANDEDLLVKLVDIPKSILQYSSGKVEIINGQVVYDDSVLNEVIADRILKMFQEGFPIDPMVNLLHNLMENTSFHTIKYLYDWLELRGIPITEDGCFLCQKAVRNDFLDKHSGTFDNSPGKEVRITRNKVDENHRNECSFGLHVADPTFASGFANGDDRIVLVKVNPKDIVAVCEGEGYRKVRCEGYLVLHEIPRQTFLDKAVYQNNGLEFENDEDDDWDSDEDGWNEDQDDIDDMRFGL